MVSATLMLEVLALAVVAATVEMEVVMVLEVDRPPAMTLLEAMPMEVAAATVVAKVEV